MNTQLKYVLAMVFALIACGEAKAFYVGIGNPYYAAAPYYDPYYYDYPYYRGYYGPAAAVGVGPIGFGFGWGGRGWGGRRHHYHGGHRHGGHRRK